MLVNLTMLGTFNIGIQFILENCFILSFVRRTRKKKKRKKNRAELVHSHLYLITIIFNRTYHRLRKIVVCFQLNINYFLF